MKRILFTFICILLVKLSFAGINSNTSVALSGTVIDAATRKPLADVTIIAINGGVKSEVTTNSQGQFKIAQLPQGTYIVKFALDDYRTQEKKMLSSKPTIQQE
jgi:5-hydroxyisourate hydrolase-like protein (transthyretin family)